jgi:hypothetical protein
MTRKINNSYELGQSNAPTDGGDMLKTRADGTLVWEGVADTTYVPLPAWLGTRGIFMGGYTTPPINNIQYITISSTGNALDFGDLTVARYTGGSLSNTTRGVFGGGRGSASANRNDIDYITVSTTGNATDFGDSTASGMSQGTANAGGN